MFSSGEHLDQMRAYTARIPSEGVAIANDAGADYSVPLAAHQGEEMRGLLYHGFSAIVAAIRETHGLQP